MALNKAARAPSSLQSLPRPVQRIGTLSIWPARHALLSGYGIDDEVFEIPTLTPSLRREPASLSRYRLARKPSFSIKKHFVLPSVLYAILSYLGISRSLPLEAFATLFRSRQLSITE